MTARGVTTGGGDVYYPLFDHGEDLLVVVKRQGYFRFQTENHRESIEADNVVYVEDWV